jgi:hypothetical protein
MARKKTEEEKQQEAEHRHAMKVMDDLAKRAQKLGALIEDINPFKNASSTRDDVRKKTSGT